MYFPSVYIFFRNYFPGEFLKNIFHSFFKFLLVNHHRILGNSDTCVLPRRFDYQRIIYPSYIMDSGPPIKNPEIRCRYTQLFHPPFYPGFLGGVFETLHIMTHLGSVQFFQSPPDPHIQLPLLIFHQVKYHFPRNPDSPSPIFFVHFLHPHHMTSVFQSLGNTVNRLHGILHISGLTGVEKYCS